MSTTDRLSEARGPYVTRDMCAAVHAEQRQANERTWEELRGLRRLVITLVIGGQLFAGGLNFAGFGYWLQQHAAQPHPATVELVAQVRAEVREDLRDLRRETRELMTALAAARDPAIPAPKKGESR